MEEKDRFREWIANNFSSQKEAAEAMGMSQQSLSSYLNGKRNIGWKIGVKLEELGADLKWIKYGTNKTQGEQNTNTNVEVKSKTNDVFSVVGFEGFKESMHIPIVEYEASAGHGSFVNGSIEQFVNLQKQYSDKTFYIKVRGDSMKNAGIVDGSMLLVNEELTPTNGDIVVAVNKITNQILVKRLRSNGKTWLLSPENEDFNKIELDQDYAIKGVVIKVEILFK